MIIKCHKALITRFQNMNCETIQKITIIVNESHKCFYDIAKKNRNKPNHIYLIYKLNT